MAPALEPAAAPKLGDSAKRRMYSLSVLAGASATGAAVSTALACCAAATLRLGSADHDDDHDDDSSSDAAIEAAIEANTHVAEAVEGRHRATIVLLPGFTGRADGLLSWFQKLDKSRLPLETLRIVAVGAPERAITCYDGWKAAAWFDYMDEKFFSELCTHQRSHMQPLASWLLLPRLF